jgi:hypothetical protein
LDKVVLGDPGFLTKVENPEREVLPSLEFLGEDFVIVIGRVAVRIMA